jgi:ABC-type antimicrobial peptide transport system permease subunit
VSELLIRKGLVVFQFTLSVIFIIAVVVVYQQIQFIQTKNQGYNKVNVLSFDMTGISPAASKAFFAEVKNIPGVINASGMDHSSLINDFGGSYPRWDGKDPKTLIEFNNIGINYDMFETLGLQLASGRSFSRNASSDSLEAIVNQAAVDAMGIKDPIGKHIDVFGDGKRTIVGVVKNFHFQSMHETIKPFVLRLVASYTSAVMVKIKAGTEKHCIERLWQLYQKYHPGYPFDYRFLDDDYQKQYVAEKRVAVLSRYFGGLAILISCLGLFGLAAFTAERRFKEIGIRKVLGASVSGVVLLLSKDFLKLVLIALLIAFPAAWWAMSQWLHGYAYRTTIGPDPDGVSMFHTREI